MDDRAATHDIADVAGLRARLDDVGHLADDGLATALLLAWRLGQPLLLEGEPGVGKTSAALAMARVVGVPPIRLQCFEGIAVHEAMYEWNHARQLLAIRAAEAAGSALPHQALFTDEYLLDRPLLQALRTSEPGRPAVLLIDEIDRADDEFEALLYEVLGEHAITVPELGTIRAAEPPLVILTSNRTRELHDALKRRCLYHWIEHPGVDLAAAIVRRHVRESPEPLVAQATSFVARARALELDKPPGLAETIDWVRALEVLGITELPADAPPPSMGSLAKTPDDLAGLWEFASAETSP